MEHWLTIIRTAGDLIYLAAAVLTLTAIRTERSTHDNEPDEQ